MAIVSDSEYRWIHKNIYGISCIVQLNISRESWEQQLEGGKKSLMEFLAHLSEYHFQDPVGNTMTVKLVYNWPRFVV